MSDSAPVTRQLVLDLTLPPGLTRADFLPAAANAAAYETLNATEGWPQRRMLLLGPEGAGKTHLASIWAAENNAPLIAAENLNVASADQLVSDGGALVVENADLVAGTAAKEAAMFHLWNLCGQRGCVFLLTSRLAPRDWGLTLPDLRSRMDAMPQVRLEQPDEALLSAVLVKLFADRQMIITPGLIDWLVLRMDRDLGAARRLVAALDHASLARKNPVTRKIAAELLNALSETDR